MTRPYYEDEFVTLYHGRCEDVLPTLGDGSVDLVATDPPYFRVKDEEWDRAWDDAAAFLAWIGARCDDCRRVLKASGSFYMFAGPDMERHVTRIVEERFRLLNVVRWEKEEGWHNKAERESLREFLSAWEAVVFAEQRATEYDDAAKALHLEVYAPIGRHVTKLRETAGLSRGAIDTACSPSQKPTGLCYRWESGDCLPTHEQYVALRRACGSDASDEELRREYEELRRPFSLTRRSPATDIWRFKTVAPYPGKHPCEKPIALMEHIVRASSRPGDLVLDPFAGSGSTLLAARNLRRRAIGVEQSADHCAEISSRLSQSVLDLGGAA